MNNLKTSSKSIFIGCSSSNEGVIKEKRESTWILQSSCCVFPSCDAVIRKLTWNQSNQIKPADPSVRLLQQSASWAPIAPRVTCFYLGPKIQHLATEANSSGIFTSFSPPIETILKPKYKIFQNNIKGPSNSFEL